MKTIQKILVATDFSGDSRAALDGAVDLAEKLNAEVYLFHAVDRIVDCAADYCLETDKVEGAKDEMIRTAREKLDHEIRRFSERRDVKITPELRYGNTYEEILKAEKEKGVDLLVMGPHPRKSAWERFRTHLSDRIEKDLAIDTLLVHGAA
ncbi:MAG TPA: universal stress protein [Spirochaetota bacterium]|nr:universal stress protein [Spirochaetota bacterium]